MKLAIAAIRQQVKELEVKRDQARDAANSLKKQLDAKLEEANELERTIADFKAIVTAVDVDKGRRRA